MSTTVIDLHLISLTLAVVPCSDIMPKTQICSNQVAHDRKKSVKIISNVWKENMHQYIF